MQKYYLFSQDRVKSDIKQKIIISQTKQIDMKTIEQKRKYEKPAMQVVQLKQQPALLAGSAPNQASFDNYEEGEFTW